MAPDVAAVLMCAGVAVFTPLRRYVADGSGRVGIYRVGGLGHLAIQFAHALGYEVTAFSSSPTREREAREFGADQFVVLGHRDRMRPFDYAFDLVLCTAHGDIDWEELTNAMDKRGRIVLVGFPNVSIQPTNLVAHELSITGSLLGNRATVREMLSFADGHDIVPRTEHLPMDGVYEAIARLKANRARYRIVLGRELPSDRSH
jgi:D-arabinose 1-dehydrogenase-like Zn-dependent alcohol dehydrogenase